MSTIKELNKDIEADLISVLEKQKEDSDIKDITI